MNTKRKFAFSSLAFDVWRKENPLVISGADPGFFLGGGALVSSSTSTPINHIVFFFFAEYKLY